MCIGEYPNNTTVIINNTIQDTFSVSKTNSDDQLQVNVLVTVPMASTFIVGVLLSNNGGEFLLKPTFQFGIEEFYQNHSS